MGSSGLILPQTLIHRTILSGTQATINIDLSNFQQFKHLRVIGLFRHDSTSANALLRLSNDGSTPDTGNNYDTQFIYGNGSGDASKLELLAQSSMIVGSVPNFTNQLGYMDMMIYNYTDTSFDKGIRSLYAKKEGTDTGYFQVFDVMNWWRNTGAIKGLHFLFVAGNFDAPTDIQVFGLM